MAIPARPLLPRLICSGLIVLALLAGAAMAKVLPAATSAAAAEAEAEAVNALIGELVFQADLMSALDSLCPRGRVVDWHDGLARRVRDAYSPELRELSRKLGRVAGLQLVRERGGCQASGFDAAYDESQQDYRELLQRWRAVGD
jgi:hypothetical protein